MNNSARKDEIAKRHAAAFYSLRAVPVDAAELGALTNRIVMALTSYEEARTPTPPSAAPDENGSMRCPNGHSFVYRSPEDASLQCMRCERDHFAEQLGLVYDHVTNGLLSKPYDLRGVKSTIDDCITEHVNQAVKEELEERTPSGEGSPAIEELRRGAASRLRMASTRAHRHAAGRRDTIGRHRDVWQKCEHPDCAQDRVLADAIEPMPTPPASRGEGNLP